MVSCASAGLAGVCVIASSVSWVGIDDGDGVAIDKLLVSVLTCVSVSTKTPEQWIESALDLVFVGAVVGASIGGDAIGIGVCMCAKHVCLV